MNVFSNIGVTELIVILLLALLVFGPERLPELARQAGNLLRGLRKAYENLSRDLGPELSSFQQTALELRDSVQAVRSIRQDLVKTVVQSADMGDTMRDLKDTVGTIQQVGTLPSGKGGVQQPAAPALTAATQVLEAPDNTTEAVAQDGEGQEARTAPEAPPDDAGYERD
jgi:sec-independent protein translocase protein TatB